MNKKILFVDLDGTLLDVNKNVSEKNQMAINEAIKLGHKFVISSGRPLKSVIKISEKYGWNKEGVLLSCFNGSLIYNCENKEIISECCLDKKFVRTIFDKCYKHGVHAHTYSDFGVITERENQLLFDYCKAIKISYELVDDVMTYLEKPPIKVVAISDGGHAVLDGLRKEIDDIFGDDIYTVFSSERLLEFANPNASKGKALKVICNKLNIPISDSIAIGDEENDVTMINEAGIGVAMANGSKIIKECADYITINDNNKNGVSEVIEKFVI